MGITAIGVISPIFSIEFLSLLLFSVLLIYMFSYLEQIWYKGMTTISFFPLCVNISSECFSIALRFPWPTKPFDNLLTLLHHPFIYAYFLNNYCFFFVFSSYVFFDYFLAQSIEEPFFYYCGILCKYSS